MSPDAKPRLAPGPRGLSRLSALSARGRDRISTMQRLRERFGDVVRLDGGGVRVLLLSNPEHVKHVLVDRAANYPKNEGRGTLTGLGLFGSEGELWKRQRAMVQQGFHREKLAGMADVIVRETQAMLDRWEPLARSGETFDVGWEMSELVLGLMTQLVCSAPPSQAMKDGIRLHLHFLDNPRPPLTAWFFRTAPRPLARLLSSRAAKYKAVIRDMDAWAYGLIRERREAPADGVKDITSMLLAARDPSGQGMTDEQLRDELMTLVVAGHEATAVALTWTLLLLDRHPEAWERLRAEVLAAIGERAPTAADLPALGYAQRVFQEAMRLYPPAWMFSRIAEGPDQLGGYDVLPGTMVTMLPYFVHRHPDAWEAPESFDPDRFLPARAAGRSKFAYIPFGGGQRLCLGNNLAQMKATLVLSLMAQRYRVEVREARTMEWETQLTLKPKGGLHVRLVPAQAAPARAQAAG